MRFKKFNGEDIADIAPYIKEYFSNGFGGEYEIYIGCDSLPPKKKVTTFVTVVCVRHVGKGCHILYKKDKVNNPTSTYSLVERLWKEVELSVGVASYLRDNGVLNYASKMSKVKFLHLDIHLDINPDPAQKSHVLYNSATGFVKGMGFDFVTKPDAWAATYAADMVVRGRFDKVASKLTK